MMGLVINGMATDLGQGMGAEVIHGIASSGIWFEYIRYRIISGHADR